MENKLYVESLSCMYETFLHVLKKHEAQQYKNYQLSKQSIIINY